MEVLVKLTPSKKGTMYASIVVPSSQSGSRRQLGPLQASPRPTAPQTQLMSLDGLAAHPDIASSLLFWPSHKHRRAGAGPPGQGGVHRWPSPFAETAAGMFALSAFSDRQAAQEALTQKLEKWAAQREVRLAALHRRLEERAARGAALTPRPPPSPRQRRLHDASPFDPETGGCSGAVTLPRLAPPRSQQRAHSEASPRASRLARANSRPRQRHDRLRAATRIQARTRGALSRKHGQVQLHSAILVQAQWRAKIARARRQRTAAHRARQNLSAVMIQSRYRARAGRRLAQWVAHNRSLEVQLAIIEEALSPFEQMRASVREESARVIQKWWRSRWLRGNFIQAALALQKLIRAQIERQKRQGKGAGGKKSGRLGGVKGSSPNSTNAGARRGRAPSQQS